MYILLLLLCSACSALTQVVGKPFGFAAGVTGGGSASPVTPADINELKRLLADDVPRVIRIDKTFNFIGSEGTVSARGCQFTSGCTAANGGQDYIKDRCDSGEKPITVKYDKAGYTGLAVGSNKSILGVGSRGILVGKGLRLNDGARNIIIQNIHIDNLNPQYIWGGDALNLQGNDGVWIDHCKISRVGRQMLVTHFGGSRVTISNTEFDGRTPHSRSCDGRHYWTALLLGKGDKITLYRNWFHHTSGRAPKIGAPGDGPQTVHALNNLFEAATGHNFDVAGSAHVLIEGNAFISSKAPITPTSAGVIFDVPDTASLRQCSSALGRACAVNTFASSGPWKSLKSTGVLTELGKSKAIVMAPRAANTVLNSVRSNAGVGKI
ncbi:Pectate lyase-like protein 11 [Elsinoe fawcettii]|nr:Pectate lyase-like protein 11 [Elsinoe fawcettii]